MFYLLSDFSLIFCHLLWWLWWFFAYCDSFWISVQWNRPMNHLSHTILYFLSLLLWVLSKSLFLDTHLPESLAKFSLCPPESWHISKALTIFLWISSVFWAHFSNIYADSSLMNWKEHWNINQKFLTYSLTKLLAQLDLNSKSNPFESLVFEALLQKAIHSSKQFGQQFHGVFWHTSMELLDYSENGLKITAMKSWHWLNKTCFIFYSFIYSTNI